MPGDAGELDAEVARVRAAGERAVRQGAAAAERRRARRAEHMAAALAALAAAVDEEEALRALLRGAIDALEGEHGVARLFDVESGVCRLVVRLDAGGALHQVGRDQPLAAGSFAAGVASGGGPRLVRDFQALDADAYPYGARMREKGMRSAVLVPIDAPAGRIGCLSVDHSAPGFFDEEHVAAACALAGQAAAAIERARQDERFRALTEHSHDAIMLVDARGAIRYVSPGRNRILGYPPEERLGADAFDVVHPEDAPCLRQLFARLLQQPGASDTAEVRCRHKDGSWRWLEVVGSNLLEVPSVRAVVVNYRDIGARKHAEEQHAERLRLDGALLVARTVAHELNNALTPVSGFAELLASRPEIARDPALAAYVRLISDSARTAAEKVLQLQRIARLQEMESPLGPDQPVLDLERSTAPVG